MLSYIFVLHQTTTRFSLKLLPASCLISLFYIKPQPSDVPTCTLFVVLYLCSTSNHNQRNLSYFLGWVVLYLCSTSNHNCGQIFKKPHPLSYIFVLHQTTTHIQSPLHIIRLSYIFVLHQTTTNSHSSYAASSCLISLFYIKPQPFLFTENRMNSCLISLFYIKPQLVQLVLTDLACCLISLFYIKPQLMELRIYTLDVVLYLCSTSNHNRVFYLPSCGIVVLYLCSTSNHNHPTAPCRCESVVLYLCSTSNHNSIWSVSCAEQLSYIFVLHQTTTCCWCNYASSCCLISLFYIKPQLAWDELNKANCCLISLFYIKPQPWPGADGGAGVVLYLCSTSNHN